MVSLKMSAAEAKAEGYGSPAEIKPPKYPYGTCLHLDNEVAKALFPGGMPTVGQACTVTGNAIVSSVSSSEQEGGKARLSIDLQMTDMDLGGDKPSAAEKLYGKDGPKK